VIPSLTSELGWFCLGVLCALGAYVALRICNALYHLTLTVYHAYRVERARIALREYLDAHAPQWRGDPVHVTVPLPRSSTLPATQVAEVDGWLDVGRVTRH
jgi:hypothetical protein